MVRVYSAGSLIHFCRSAAVRPEVRCRSARPGGRASIAASRSAIGAFPLAGRLWQWGQQVSAVTAARARDSTAVKQISPGVRPAVAAARAASPAMMLWARSSAQLPGGPGRRSARAGRGRCRGRSSSGEGTRFRGESQNACIGDHCGGNAPVIGIDSLLALAAAVRRLRVDGGGPGEDGAECTQGLPCPRSQGSAGPGSGVGGAAGGEPGGGGMPDGGTDDADDPGGAGRPGRGRA